MNLVFAFIFWKAGTKDAGTHFGALVNLFIGCLIGSAQPAILNFPTERPIFMREYAVGMYSIVTYFISKVIVELPLEFIRCLIVMLLAYWIQDL